MSEQIMPKVTFGRDKRLLTARDYQAVFGGTQFKVAHPHLLLLARPNQLDHSRLGLVVAKKHIRHAVHRNRVKRVVRDTFRLVQHQFNPLDVVFLVRPGLDMLSPAEQTALLQKSWQRLVRKQSTETNSADKR